MKKNLYLLKQTFKMCITLMVYSLLTMTLHANDILPAMPDYSDSTQWYVQDRHAAADIFYVISTESGDYLTPDDVKQVVPAVLQHRLVLTAEAEMEGYTPQKVASRLLDKVEVPK